VGAPKFSIFSWGHCVPSKKKLVWSPAEYFRNCWYTGISTTISRVYPREWM